MKDGFCQRELWKKERNITVSYTHLDVYKRQVYEITKDPIAKQEAQAKAEAYEQVFTDAAAFEAVEMLSLIHI